MLTGWAKAGTAMWHLIKTRRVFVCGIPYTTIDHAGYDEAPFKELTSLFEGKCPVCQSLETHKTTGD